MAPNPSPFPSYWALGFHMQSVDSISFGAAATPCGASSVSASATTSQRVKAVTSSVRSLCLQLLQIEAVEHHVGRDLHGRIEEGARRVRYPVHGVEERDDARGVRH